MKRKKNVTVVKMILVLFALALFPIMTHSKYIQMKEPNSSLLPSNLGRTRIIEIKDLFYHSVETKSLFPN